MDSRLEDARSFRSEIVFTLFSDLGGELENPVGCIRLEFDATALPFLLLFFFFRAEAISASPSRLKSNLTAGDSAGDRERLLFPGAAVDGGARGVARSTAADDFLVDLFLISCSPSTVCCCD
ncbi:molecular chaperone Hsp40/DnaJ family protein [Striga asiatica]|uniref:Molecular chaperone Hsp40/DnaJ family protein n=1 Tax=Striga asiatica TaxID=4170 RepID=A0A5A7RGD7_STRAF|nr:molecular chaperone Hsp40/DnaJ family protein [Striga asiatica]